MSRRRLLLICGGVALAGGVLCLLAGWLLAVAALVRLGWITAAIGALWLVAARFKSDEPMRAHQRRYQRDALLSMLAYMGIMLLVWPLVEHVHDTPARILIAVLPVAPMVFLVRAFVRFVRDSDELQQRLYLVALSVSSAIVGLLSMTVGFMAAAKVVSLDGTALMFVFPVMAISFGAARWWAARRYGVKGGC